MKQGWFLVLLAVVFAAGCSGEKRVAQYSEIYSEKPAVVYVAPLCDLAMRHAVRTTEDSLYNASITAAAAQLYLTASDPLRVKGYYVPGPMATAQIAATEARSGKQLRNENINDYYTDLGVDAVLFIDLIGWKQTSSSWSVETEYTLRSTHTNSELWHVRVSATKHLPTDNKGRALPLSDDLQLQQILGLDLETTQRCRLVEILNQYVLKDLPSGSLSRAPGGERYATSHPEYFTLRINRDGSVEMLKSLEL